MIIDSSLITMVLPLISVVLLINDVNFVESQSILEFFGLNTESKPSKRMPLDDITSQSIGLINYIRAIQKNPSNDNLWKKLNGALPTLPEITLLDGVPAIPGLTGSLTGAGGCLPKYMPLVNHESPNFFQNFLRFIPGAQDYLLSLIQKPDINANALIGKYQWVVSTVGVHDRYCPTTEFKNLLQNRNTSTFTTVDSFYENGPRGPAKVGFGYGLIHHRKVNIYFQENPCPYQIVMVGPIDNHSKQYEYVVISNWAKYPVIGLARNLEVFNSKYRKELVERFKNEGLIHDFSDLIGNSINFVDWSQCKVLSPIGFVMNIMDRLFSG
ncbi:unnamed protein product [Dracunculus medinensis]|uniref:Cyanoexosortase B system-associated protein n=1 Tax=Dracunculus medinensis TaxID=318479 RepID=A0A0N4U8B8_DRAME|nr:unnamed protein product [Dracunculus medinensis]